VDQPDINALTSISIRQTSEDKVLIRSQVRAHPAPVLPVAGGRYSLGFWCLLGELTVWSQPESYPLMCLNRSASRGRLHFRVLRTRWRELFPRVQLTPFKLFCPSQFTSSNAEDAVGLIVSPHVPECLTVSCVQSLTAPPTTRSTG
jgi:hypothetical protein